MTEDSSGYERHIQRLNDLLERMKQRRQLWGRPTPKILPDGIYYTWKELYRMEAGTYVKEWMEGDIPCIIMRGSICLTAYIGVPLNEAGAKFDYEDIPLGVHGGVTFSQKGDDLFWPEGYWWYGWDYGHFMDYLFLYDDLYLFPPYRNYWQTHKKKKKWLVQHVIPHVKDAVRQFKQLQASMNDTLNSLKKTPAKKTKTK